MMMEKMLMKQRTFKSGLFTALAGLAAFEALPVDPSVLNTTRSLVSTWNKANPGGPTYKVIRTYDTVHVLRIK